MAESSWAKDADKRTPPGRVWMDLIIAGTGAIAEKNTDEGGRLFELADMIEKQYPEEVAEEKAFWKGLSK